MTRPGRRRTASLLAPLLAVAVLAGCGDEPGLDTGAVETFLVESQRATFDDLEVGPASCPQRSLTEGMTLPCTLDVADASVPYTVRLRDVHEEDVRIDVTLAAVVLRGAEIEQLVVSSLPKDFASAEVVCGSDLIVAEVGDSVDCTLSAGAQTKAIAVTVEDEAGHVSIA